MKKLYKDINGECEYYIVKLGNTEYESHGFEPAGNIPEDDGWKHYERRVNLTGEDIQRAIDQYGAEDADFLAAMDNLQEWCNDYEFIADEEKSEIVKQIEKENPGD